MGAGRVNGGGEEGSSVAQGGAAVTRCAPLPAIRRLVWDTL
jgi:hypothetical protein